MDARDLTRFWSKVKIGDQADCWEWQAGKDWDGYGIFSIRSKTYRAHRLIWQVYNNQSANGLTIAHWCDNPSCVNPSHLRGGDHLDNVRDRDQKGRQAKGSRNGFSKLGEADIVEIRRRIAGGDRQKDIAADYEVSPYTISKIHRRVTWGWLT